MFRKQKLFVMAFFVLFIALIFGSFTWLLNIISSRFSYLPSVYHVYLPSFKRLITEDDKKNNERHEEVKLSNQGNLRGVTSKLKYIKSLNVDYLYLSPFFQSPKMDGGYDVSDYRKIDPYYGTNQDFKDLLNQAKEEKLKVMVDLVLNHSSYKHEFFAKALSSLSKSKNEQQNNDNNKYVSYYYFFKATEQAQTIKDEKTPPKVKLLFDLDGKKKGDLIDLPWWNDTGLNESKKHPYTFIGQEELRDLKKIAKKGKGAKYKGEDENGNDEYYQPWEREKDENGKEVAGYYYLYTFSWFQPDLNWNNKDVQKEMFAVANYWINQGVQGFRFDAIPLIAATINDSLTLPNPHKLKNFLKKLKTNTYGKEKDFLTIGELSQDGESKNYRELTTIAKDVFNTAYLPLNNLYEYLDKTGFPRAVKNIRININFKEFKRNEYLLNNLNTNNFKQSLIMDNHDHIRAVSRYAGSQDNNYNFKYDKRLWIFKNWYKEKLDSLKFKVLDRSKVLAIFKFLQCGYPLIFNGSEIGMTNDLTTSKSKFVKGMIDRKSKFNYFVYSVELQSKQAFFRRNYDKSRKSEELLEWNFHNDLGRNSARTIFQWKGEKEGKKTNAGFCSDDDENCKLWNGKNEPKKYDAYEMYLKNERFKTLDNYIGKFEKLNGKNVLNKNYRKFNSKMFDEEVSLFYSNNVANFPILNPNYKDINVEDQEKNLNSPLNFYRRLLDIRKHNSILQQGNFKELKNGKDFQIENFNNLGSQMVAAYTRGGKYLIIINLDFIPYQVKIDLGKNLKKRILLNTHKKIEYNENNHFLNLEPYQGLLIKI